MKKRNFSFIMMVFLAIFMLFPVGVGKVDAASVLSPGSKGSMVWDLQYRLKIVGYYPYQMDGVYGYQTTKSVRSFQYNYGLRVDGKVGAQTWSALKKHSVNAKELELLAKVVHSEARGEPYVGKVSVAAVVMNRLQSPKFPNSINGIIFEPGAFTAVDDGQFWLTPNKQAYQAAWEAVRGWDPSKGALYYFNPDTATSSWMWTRPQTVRIANHIFTK